MREAFPFAAKICQRNIFARSVADRVPSMYESYIVEETPPENFFSAPEHRRAKLFLRQILSH